MNKKTVSTFFIIIFAVFCILLIAYAADGTIDTDGIYDIGAYGNDSTITIDSLASTAGLDGDADEHLRHDVHQSVD